LNTLNIQNFPPLPFRIQESLNQLRINLSFFGEDIKVIMVTSSTPNEGKSFISIQLWKMMADLGMKSLLIDADLRNSTLRQDYEAGSDEEEIKDIAHFLAGKASIQDVIHATNFENAYVIPVAQNIANPTLLLEKKRFGQMIEACKETFDYVIIDTPPLGSVADALKIATHCDGTALVVRAGETPRKLVENSVSQLKPTGTPLLGMILNRMMPNSNNAGYYNKYYSKYSYYRHYGKEKENQPAVPSAQQDASQTSIEQNLS
jgi:capsular exopolysaccharide synthesis family protein